MISDFYHRYSRFSDYLSTQAIQQTATIYHRKQLSLLDIMESYMKAIFNQNCLSEYIKKNPGESSYRYYMSGDNPSKYFSYHHHLFYQESETEAFVYMIEREEKQTVMYVMIHLKLDLENNRAYVDDVWSERWDDDELTEGAYDIVENSLLEIHYVLSTIQYYFLGDIQLMDDGERTQKLTGDDWEKYEQYINL